MIAKRTEKMRVIAKAFNMGTVGLIPRGRVVIANSVLSSQLTHVLSCAQGMTKKKLKCAQTAILSFVNHKQIMRYDQSQLPCGGLGCPNLHLRYISAKVSLLKKAIKASIHLSNTTANLPWVSLFSDVLKAISLSLFLVC